MQAVIGRAIVAVLKQTEIEVPAAELIRKVVITEQTLYRWKLEETVQKSGDRSRPAVQTARGRERATEARGRSGE